MTDSPVDEFLDQLLAASAGSPPRDARSLLAEAEAHLLDATAEGMARGMSRADAEHDAVSRFGPVGEVARREAERHALPLKALVRPCVASGLLLGGLAGIAMGISAAITAIMGAIGGSTFIVNISSTTRLAPSDCTRWLRLDPAAHSCYQAALSDWAGEAIAYRAALGVLGIAALLAYFFLQGRTPAALPRPIIDAAAFTVFATAGLWLAGWGIDAVVVNSGRGAGQGLGTAPAMLVLAAAFGLRVLRDLRTSSSGMMPTPTQY